MQGIAEYSENKAITLANITMAHGKSMSVAAEGAGAAGCFITIRLRQFSGGLFFSAAQLRALRLAEAGIALFWEVVE